MGVAARQALWGGKKLPYAKRVEYIASTGSQYINTGIKARPTQTIVFDLQYTTTTPPDGLGMQNGVWDLSSSGCVLVFTSQGGNFIAYTRDQLTFTRFSDTARHVARFDLPNRRIYFDGTQYSTTLKSTAESDGPLYIFARNLIGTGAQHFCVEKFFAFYIEEAGERVLDLIPVIDRKGQAKMFDLVSGTYPEHYGTFTPGPEIIMNEGLALILFTQDEACWKEAA